MLTATVLGTPPVGVDDALESLKVIFTVACAAVVAVGLVVMLWRCRGHRRQQVLGLLVVLGAALSMIQEPLVDTLGNMYIPPSDLEVFTTFGREMPLFAPFGYALYFGFPMVVYITSAQLGATSRTFMKLFAGSVVLELAFELTAVNTDMYTYYGEQGLSLFGLPLHWMTLNGAAAWVGAAAVHKALPHLHGGRIVAVPPIVVCTVSASYYGQGFPVFSAMHTESPSRGGVIAGSLVTFIIGLAVIRTMIHLLASPQQTASASTRKPELTSRTASGDRPAALPSAS